MAGLESYDQRRTDVDAKARMEGVDESNRDVRGFGWRGRFIRPRREGRADGQDAAENESGGRKEPHESRERNSDGVVMPQSGIASLTL